MTYVVDRVHECKLRRLILAGQLVAVDCLCFHAERPRAGFEKYFARLIAARRNRLCQRQLSR